MYLRSPFRATLAVLAAAVLTSTLGVAPAEAAPSCGPTVYKSNGTPWRCTFADDFNGGKLDRTKWMTVTSAISEMGKRADCFVNDPRNISVANGILKLTTRRAAAPFQCGRPGRTFTATATSAMISTHGKFTQNHGRYEIRAKFPMTTTPGLQSAFWLWPDKNDGYVWPLTGEIDIAEWYSNWADRVIPYLHYGGGLLLPRNVTNNYCMVPNVGNWHTYTLEWVGRTLVISYDGKVCLRNDNWWVLGDGMFTVQLMQALGLDKNAPTAATPLPSSAQISYVRVWS